MKILISLFAIALASVLVVSATMGAETLVPGAEAQKAQPAGGAAPSRGKARLSAMSFTPLALRGTGFKARENVTVKVMDGVMKKTRRVRASGTGSFVVRVALGADTCSGFTVVAVGDRGSRTGFQFSQFVC
jgi:hypothetical protein